MPVPLPPELLEYIFFLSNPVIRIHSYFSGTFGFGAAEVCRQWRAIALSSPRLWTSMKVSVYDGKDLLELKRNIKRVLKLSAGRRDLQHDVTSSKPLTIGYAFQPSVTVDRDLEAVARHQECLDLLLDQADRWVSAELDIFTGMNFDKLATSNLSGLRHLAIRPRQSVVPPSLHNLPIFGSLSPANFPNLRSLIVDLSRYRGDFSAGRQPVPNYPFPWSQLTSFSAIDSTESSVTFPDIVNSSIICQLTNIVDLRLHGNGNSSWFESSYNPNAPARSRLPYLRTLTIRNAGSLFSAVELPALHDLTITRVASSLPGLADLLARTDCPIQHLSVLNWQFEQKETSLTPLHSLMNGFMHLRILDIQNSWHGVKLLSVLAPPASDPSIQYLPNLETLRMLTNDTPSTSLRHNACDIVGDVLESFASRVGTFKMARISIVARPETSVSTSTYRSLTSRLDRLWKEAAADFALLFDTEIYLDDLSSIDLGVAWDDLPWSRVEVPNEEFWSPTYEHHDAPTPPPETRTVEMKMMPFVFYRGRTYFRTDGKRAMLPDDMDGFEEELQQFNWEWASPSPPT